MQRTFLYGAILAVGGAVAAWSAVSSQAPKAQKPAAPAAAAAAEDCGCDDVPSGPQVWATVDGVKIMDTDLQSSLAANVDPVLKQLKELRQQGLEELINNRLFDKEAKAARVSRAEYLKAQVDSKIQPPSNAEIQQWIDQNRTKLNRDPADAEFRRDVAVYLKEQNRIKAVKALGEQLRKKSEVHILPEATSTSTDPTKTLAMVDGQPVRRSELDEAVKAQSYDLKKQIYDFRKQAVDQKVNSMLLDKEAQRRGTTSQRLLNQEVLDKAPLITQEQADAFYAANKAQIQQPLEAIRPQLMTYLRQQAIAKEEEKFLSGLKKTAKVTISLPMVTEPVFAINTLGRPTKGGKDARVTIVEFTDYECPRCSEVQPIIKDLLAAFPDKVRLVVREFPLNRHPFARVSAQAAECALEQGKYWEYTDLLFKNQNALDDSHLLQYATQVGMDKSLLAAHLKSGQHDKVVQEDIDDGYQAGVNGTPSFYVNGRRLEDRSLDGFKQAVQRALSASN